MSILRAQVSIPRESGLPEDVVCNTFHFNTSPDYDVEAAAGEIKVRLTAFYNADNAGAGTLVSIMSKVLIPEAATIKVYDLGDPTPRVPIHESNAGISATNPTAGYPSEVCVTLSFHSEYVSGTPRGRCRNRIYFGPVANTVGSEDSHGELRVSAANRGRFNNAMFLLTEANTADVVWAAHSTLAPGGTTGRIVGGWTDDTFDTQRRRGPSPAARTTWAATP